MEYNIENITEYEKICLDSLKETCDKYEMDTYYSIGEPCEQRVCVCKRKSNWEVFMVERGIEFEKNRFEKCLDACIEVIHYCSYTREEFNDASTDYKSIFKNKILVKK